MMMSKSSPVVSTDSTNHLLSTRVIPTSIYSSALTPTSYVRPPHPRNRIPSRDRCIIISNLKLSESASLQSRLDDDVSAFKSTLATILPDDNRSLFNNIAPVCLIRLNKSTKSNHLRPPLLKIVFRHSSHASVVLSQRLRFLTT
ncbi:hypothetical protein GJ496_000592 [Pomphorhynchus laevis]|nr:hypothetical protein GJ496_000592 [Pomphorhynchus laevis]